MISRRSIVFSLSALIILGFGAAAYFMSRPDPIEIATTPVNTALERPYSPRFGPDNAPVTVVEFFDPACEACRAFHPIVKEILATYPEDVRLILRYTPFHNGSEDVVRILEAARLQGVFAPVLDAVLEAQPSWAAHGAPRLEKAWEAASSAGLDIVKAKQDILMPDMTAIINQDKADVATAKVKGTPTFFVNGKPLPSFGKQQLFDLIEAELKATRGSND